MADALDMHDWLEVSGLLLRQLLPPGGATEYFGQNLSPDAFAELVQREKARVDHALVAMATSAGEQDVKAIVEQLDRDTLIALFSRWGQFAQLWRDRLGDPAFQHWVPPRWSDIWRALFLSMTTEGIHSTAAARSLWPEVFGER